ncbi:MAG: beta-ketoacyl-ACP synthase II [Gemmatimonadetes bacterium]|nr:beta-ketoacyl-ACP synthase II [Gemmatimonadota bacterium]
MVPEGPDGERPPRGVVITGLGPITASGVGTAQLWEGLHGGISPVRRITRFDPSPWRSQIAAEVNDFQAEHHMDHAVARRLDRFGQFSVAATRLALEDAGLDPGALEPTRVAVIMGSALGGLAHAQDQMTRFLSRGVRGVDPRVVTTVFCGAASCQIAIEFGFTGPNSTNAMSCASGTIALGEAFRMIRNGLCDAAVAGGVEAPLASLSFGAFSLVRAMSRRNDDPRHACRPFDAARDGFVMGEGACVLVLEEAEAARARGAHVYAEVLGFGLTNDAHHMTAPRPDGARAAAAMRLALEEAGVSPEALDHVNAHASSTPMNDSTETLAIRLALGAHADRVSVSGTKPFYGHALGASGAIEAAITCMSMEHGWAPPTLNLDSPGEGCDLDYVDGGGRRQRIRVALTNSFGFGGINASLVLRAPTTSTASGRSAPA